MDVLLACDLGCILHLAVVVGTSKNPVLLETAKITWRSGADTEAVVSLIEELVERRGVGVMACEETFTERRRKKLYLFNIGRDQEAQASFLEGRFMGKVRVMRVPMCYGAEPAAAWSVFGRPEEAKSEHLKDAIAVGLKCLIRLEDEKKGICDEK